MENLKTRGVKSVGFVVSDGLMSIENASANVFPRAKHQLCVVHFKRNVLAVFPLSKRAEIGVELQEVFQVETKNITPVASFEKLINFVKKGEN